jgi:hypothetical protein
MNCFKSQYKNCDNKNTSLCIICKDGNNYYCSKPTSILIQDGNSNTSWFNPFKVYFDFKITNSLTQNTKIIHIPLWNILLFIIFVLILILLIIK